MSGPRDDIAEATDGPRYSLELTECNHADNEFYALGSIAAEVPPKALFDWLPTVPVHDCDAADVCFMVDLWEWRDGYKWGHVDDREVNQVTAEKLLGRDLATARADAAPRAGIHS